MVGVYNLKNIMSGYTKQAIKHTNKLQRRNKSITHSDKILKLKAKDKTETAKLCFKDEVGALEILYQQTNLSY